MRQAFEYLVTDGVTEKILSSKDLAVKKARAMSCFGSVVLSRREKGKTWEFVQRFRFGRAG